MARPTTTPFQEELYSSLEPLADQDEDLGWPLLKYCGAIASMYDQIYGYAVDGPDGQPGWSVLLDLDRIATEAPEALPWLAAITGGRGSTNRVNTLSNRNLVAANQSFESGSSGYTLASVGAAFAESQVRAPGLKGSQAYHGEIIGNASRQNPVQRAISSSNGLTLVNPSLPYSASVDARFDQFDPTNPGSYITMILLWYKSDGVTASTIRASDEMPTALRRSIANGAQLGAQFQMVMENYTPPSDAAYVAIRVTSSHPAGAPTNLKITVDDFAIVQATSAPNFFYPGIDTLAQWDGTAGSSTISLYRPETDNEYHQRLASVIRQATGLKRGTPEAIIAAAKQYLTGNQTVILRERDGDPYSFTVLTYASETPNPAQVQTALNDQKPAGLIMTYVTVAGSVYIFVRVTYTDYAAIRSSFATYSGFRNNQPGT